jgi:hypothetical protein
VWRKTSAFNCGVKGSGHAGRPSTPGALIRNWIGCREHWGLEAMRCHVSPISTMRTKPESGSCPESIFGTGCSTVRTPARFKYSSICSCPGWPQWGWNHAAAFPPERSTPLRMRVSVRRNCNWAELSQPEHGSSQAQAKGRSERRYGQDRIWYHPRGRCGIRSRSLLEPWPLHAKHRSCAS